MTKPFPRAILFGILALIVWAIASAVISLVLVGLPGARDAAAEFQRNAIQQATTVDLFVGPIVLLVFGWLAARPFTGKLAIGVSLLTALVLVLADLLLAIVFGNAERLDLNATALSYALKIAGGVAGGLLASRTGSEVSLDKE
jgi:hypothetical protein